MDGLSFGVDLGGTKIEIVALDGATELWRERVPTPTDDYAGTLAAIAALDALATRTVGAQGTLGVGTPGSVSPKTGLMRNCNSVVLNGKPLLADLKAAVGRDVRLANDANCFALSEATDGAGAGAPVVFGVILGTGVGGGVVVGGRLLEGKNGVAGEWGHSPCPVIPGEQDPALACYCGRRGCIETLLSGPGLAADHGRTHGERLTAAALAEHPGGEDSWRRYEARLARALASVVNVLDPDVIVLGGGVSNVTRLYEHLPGLIAEHVFSDVFETPIVPAKHGDSSGVRGAARLWP